MKHVKLRVINSLALQLDATCEVKVCYQTYYYIIDTLEVVVNDYIYFP